MGTDLVNVAKSGLHSAKKSLATTAHNLANVNTEGYSRQRTHQQNLPPVASGNIVLGTGSQISHVKRIHSQFVEKRLINSLSEKNFYESRANQLEMVENIFNEINNDGLASSMNNFFNSFRQLANQPESFTVRSMVRESGKLLVNDFHQARRRLSEAVRSIDKLMEEAVADINSSLKSVAQLNVRINQLEAISGETGDLRDERDVQIQNLAKYFSIDSYTDDQGRYIINVQNHGTLVTGDKFWELKASATPEMAKDFPGSFEIYAGNDRVGHKFKLGILGALHQTKIDDIKTIQNRLDHLAYHFAKTVNHIHSLGHSSSVKVSGENNQPTKGHLFFRLPKEINRAAEYIDLDSNLKNSLENISASLDKNSPGDNRVALAIGKLKDIPTMDKKSKTFEEYYLEGVGELSMVTNKAKINSDQTEGILAQTQALRERISGVSIDEETSNMIQYQKQFEASAKVMSTAEDMMRAILNIKR